ncbi:class-I fructose-bisphosphate aldolase, partial [Helicosporidium sp. ATCC 50920]
MTHTQLVGAWGPAALSAKDGRIRARAIAGTAKRAVAARATAFDDEMAATVASLRRSGSGLLAVDESPASAGKRLASVGLPNTVEHRQRYRHMLLGTPGLSAHISGVILHEETLHLGPPVDGAESSSSNAEQAQVLLGPWLAAKGIVPGVKLDRGLQPLPGCPGEVWASGLDDLAARCAA